MKKTIDIARISELENKRFAHPLVSFLVSMIVKFNHNMHRLTGIKYTGVIS